MSCRIPRIKVPIINALIVTLGSASMGLSLAFCSPTLSQISELFSFTSTQEIMFNVSGTICAVFGSVLINAFIPLIGQRIAGMITGAIAFVAYIVLSRANVLWLAFLMRCIAGLTIGFCSTVCPTYVCELAPEEKRGLYGYINQLLTAIGFMLPSIFGFAGDWRLNSALCCIPGGLFFIGLFFVPDKQKEEEEQKKPKVPFREVFKYKKELLISLCLMFFLQFSGVQAIISNLKPIIDEANLSIDSNIIAVVANLAQVITTVIAAFIVDRWGRKWCWLLSSVGQLVAFILLCVYDLAKTSPAVFIVGLFAEQLFYGVGTGPIPFMRTAELFNDDVRSTAMALMTAANWVMVVIVVLIWPYMKDGMGTGYSFLFYAGIQVLSIIFGVFAFPTPVVESKMVSLSDIDDENADQEEGTEQDAKTSTSDLTDEKKASVLDDKLKDNAHSSA